MKRIDQAELARWTRNENSRAYRHGITVVQLRAFIEERGRKCEICAKPYDPTKRGGGLVIDHDHSCCPSQGPRVAVVDRPRRLCGKCIRGLLCVACNAALGQFGDDPERMYAAISYLVRRQDFLRPTK